MKFKVFDVVELNDGTRATILEETANNTYKSEIINSNGEIQGIREITENNIKEIVCSK